jgi:hypothetical protein
LGGLEDDVHRAAPVGVAAQRGGRAKQHRGVAVMSACVHLPWVLRTVLERVVLDHR